MPQPEERILVPPSTVFVLRMLAAPASASLWSVLLTYEELF